MSRALSVFEYRSTLPVSAEEAFAWHGRDGAFLRLAPPWGTVQLLEDVGGIRDGGRKRIRMGSGWASLNWVAEHRNYIEGRQFEDVQTSGPFVEWVHRHSFEPLSAASCELIDHVEYRLPGGWLGRQLGGAFVRSELNRVFRYRHDVTYHDLRDGAGATSMKILVTGATGLVGTELCGFLKAGGHEVFRLTRRNPVDANDIPWNPEAGDLPKARLEGLDAVVHLAGENIAGARWSDAVKDRIRRSRVEGTRQLCEVLASLDRKPATLVCASAIGFYGNRGDEKLTEQSTGGSGFLPEVCQSWEAACEPARKAGMRVVNLRIGVVLSPQGGALQKMLLPFKLGGGGVVGSGQQYWSWVAIDDVIGAIHHALTHTELSGPVNATAPEPATNRDFTKSLGRALNRPTIVPMPAFAAKLLLGEMADDLLLGSCRVLPKRLQDSGYQFRYPSLDAALRHLLG